MEFQIIKEYETQTQDFETIGIKILNSKEKLNIVTVYRKPGIFTTQRNWQDLFDAAKD